MLASRARASIAIVLLVAGVGAARSARAQSNRPAGSALRWTIADDQFANLWFHCLAMVGYDGFGPLPLYDRAYGARARSALVDGGAPASRALRNGELRRRLERDSAFEVLHFVPLYFAGESPGTVLAALREAAGDAAAPRTAAGAPPGARVASTARRVADALPTRSERETLVALVDAVDEEWRGAFRLGVAGGTSRVGSDDELQATWDRELLPVLARYLDAADVRSGVLLVSPALGPEGRIVRTADGSMIVAVGRLAASNDPAAPLLAAVRELSFPLVRAAQLRGTTGGRVAGERASDIAATRAGALLLDVASPALARRYREMFRSLADAPPPARSFEELYPIDTSVAAGMRRAIADVMRR